MKFGLIAVALMLSAGTAVQAQDAQDAQNAATGATPAAAPAKEKLVCRREEETGSVVAKRVCHTKAEWAAMDAEADRTRNLDWTHTRRN
jgi:hypothetical protein